MGRTVLFAGIAMLLGVFAALICLELAIRLFPVADGMHSLPVTADQPYLHFTPNRDRLWSVGWTFAVRNRVHVNAQGFVNDQDYNVASKSPLLAVIGDSYVEALLVPYKQTLHGRLANIVGERGRVYSFGVSGSPLSQYLAYAKHARETYRPGGLVVVIVGNDFDESLWEYRPVPGFHYLLRRTDGSREFALVPWDPRSYTISILRHSALVRYFAPKVSVQNIAERLRGFTGRSPQFVGNVSSEVAPLRLKDSKDAVDYFLRELPQQSGVPASRIVLLLDGMRPNLYEPSGLAAAAGSYFDLMRRYLIDEAQIRGYRVVDMQERFISRHACDGVRFEWDVDPHWNGTAHEEAMMAVMATHLPQELFGPLGIPMRPTCKPLAVR